jgi:hypothetical protein
MPDFGDIDPNTGQTSQQTQWAGTPDPYAPSLANGQLTPAQWAEYQRKRRRDAILGILSVAGMTTGLGFAGQAIGAGTALAGGSGATGGGAGIGTVAGGSPWAVTPYAGTAMSVPTGAAAVGGTVGAGAGVGAGAVGGVGAGAGAGAANTVANTARGGMSARDYAALLTSIAGTVGGAMQPTPNMNPNTQTTDPNLQRLVQTMQGRLDQSEPLYKSIMAMANGLLPMQYQNGGQGR